MKEASFGDLRDRLYRDPQFKALVDQLYASMLHFKVTPYVLRDAAYMASLQFAQRNIEPLVISRRFPDEADELIRSIGGQP